MNNDKIKQYLEKLDYGPAPESDAKVKEWLRSYGSLFGHYINGTWQGPAKIGYFKTINPANLEVLARVAHGTVEDVNAAVEAAKNAFLSWSSLPGYKRAKYLYAIARAIAKNSRKFAVLESLNNGKPIRETRDFDIPQVIRNFYYYAGWAEILEKEYPKHEAGGVIAGIVPWNFPLMIATWKIAPAIAAGYTIVLKPSKTTPLSVLMLADLLINEVKLPPGVVNIVTGKGDTGDLMVQHPDVWGIDFTGSTEVGKKIRTATAGSGKHLKLELGGKSPFIVFANADLDSAIEGVVNAIWFNQGHVCCAGSRLLVEESIYQEFVQRLKARMDKLRSGQQLDKAIDIGAIHSQDQLDTIIELVETGLKEGGEIYQPKGWIQPENGYYYPPTLFTNVNSANTVVQEEIFGPVLVCMSFRTPSEAIQLANNTRYGLAASVWSQDINVALDVARQMKAGTVWINDHNRFDAAAGFGGYRESGYGREGGREGMASVINENLVMDRFRREWNPEPKLKIDNAEYVDRTYRFLIGGKLARPDGATSFEIRSPENKLLGLVGDANRKDVRNAVEAARKAADSWADQSTHLRAQILYFLAENLAIHYKRFAGVIAKQTNVALKGEYNCSCLCEVKSAIELLFHYAAMADKFEGTVQPVPERMLVNAVKEPIGVIGIKAPDEFPLLGVIAPLASAIVMGNTVVMIAGKNALSAMDLVQVIQNSDVPAGVINILTAENPNAIAKILAEHEDVDSVWYFGDAEGSRIVEAASVSNMKRTWVNYGKELDWFNVLKQPSLSKKFLSEATQVKNIWVPYGA